MKKQWWVLLGVGVSFVQIAVSLTACAVLIVILKTTQFARMVRKQSRIPDDAMCEVVAREDDEMDTLRCSAATIRPHDRNRRPTPKPQCHPAEAVTMLTTLDESALTPDRREAKRRVLEIKGKTQELFDWLSAVGLEETRN